MTARAGRNLDKNLLKLFFLGILIGFGAFLFIPCDLKATPGVETENIEDLEQFSYIPAIPRVNLLHGNIFIDGDDPANDWDTFPNKTGSGTFGDPYIIENLSIDAGGIGSGIFIKDSYSYLEIINCSATDSSLSYGNAGIRIENCTNIKIINCTLNNNGHSGIFLVSSSSNFLSGNNASYNSAYGIFMWSSSNNNTLTGNNASTNSISGIHLDSLINITLTGNIACFNNEDGIYLSSSNNNTLSGNFAYSNNDQGIYLSSSNNNTLTENTVSYNTGVGIRLGSSHDNILSGNTVIFNLVDGFWLWYSNSNLISENNASYNNRFGIRIYNSNTTTLIGNTGSYNLEIGIYVQYSYYNTLYFNIITDNVNNQAVCDSSLYNSWDNGTHGNYWGDFETQYPSAANNLTFWDTPYIINADNIDYFPLVNMDGSVAENVIPAISHPNDMDFKVGSVGNTIEWTINDSSNHEPSYIIYRDATPIEADLWTSGGPISLNLDTLPSGIYNFTIYADDGLEGIGSDYVKVSVWNELGLITHAPIFIDGDDPAHDWDTFPNKTGSGTMEDPYVIENLLLDAGGTGSGIFIRDSASHLVILNCTTINSGDISEDAGIRVLYSSNIKLINCTSSENKNYGIYLVSSYNITLIANDVSRNDGRGIFLASSSKNMFLENYVHDNTDLGIILVSSSDNNTLIGNTISNNEGTGIYLLTSQSNTLANNTVQNNTEGFYLEFADNNTLSGNIALDNTWGFIVARSMLTLLVGNTAKNNGVGIWLTDTNNITLLENICSNNYYGIQLDSVSTNNTISRNNVSSNIDFGIYLVDSSNNSIYSNIFADNLGEQASCTNSLNNRWDNGTHGNYWGDYSEKYPAATNNLTIWNTPYQIDVANIDSFPLVMMDGSAGVNYNPIISHPLDRNFTLGSVDNTLEWTINDITLQDPSYWVYQNGIPIETATWIYGSPIIIYLEAFSTGVYNFTLVFNDGLGITATDSVNVTILNVLGLFDHAPIYIDGDDPANDWEIFPNKTGSGTIFDPYLIENLFIDAGGVGSGIYIRDSTVYVEIFNCTITNSGSNPEDAGIWLENCAHILIRNCNVSGNGYDGIHWNNSYFFTLSENLVSYNNNHGITLQNSSFSIINENEVIGNMYWGILLLSSNTNALEGNNASYTEGSGISLQHSITNTLVNNFVKYNHEGFFLLNATSNLLRENVATDNLNYGVYLIECSDNSIYFNNITDNDGGQAICSASGVNFWDNGTHGNYWGDYQIQYPSATNDGTIWDTPYQINAENIDLYPLVDPSISFPPDTDTDTDTGTGTGNDSITDPSDTNSPTEPEEGNSFPIGPIATILSIIILVSIVSVVVIKLLTGRNSDEDIFSDLQLEPGTIGTAPDEPHL